MSATPLRVLYRLLSKLCTCFLPGLQEGGEGMGEGGGREGAGATSVSPKFDLFFALSTGTSVKHGNNTN